MVLFINFQPKNLIAQVSCGFENNFNVTSFEEIIANLPSTSGLPNGSNPTLIPIVFHVIHLDGHSEGVMSNVATSLIESCLDKLNQDFNSTTFNVQFCFAARDPQNSLTNGIERINGSVVDGYDSFGFIPYSNENELKNLGQNWSNHDYINVWIVTNIVSSENLVGLATFPKTTPDNIDGIVIEYEYVNGTSSVLTHEMGHFFGLYHTFEGGTETQCPINNFCDQDPNNNLTENCCINQGDRVCDTPPHLKEFGCPTGINICMNSSYDEVTNNYMSYYNCTSQSFSNGQYERMSKVLVKLRPHLLNSPACSPPCITVESNFIYDDVYYYTQSFGITIENTSIGPVGTCDWIAVPPTRENETNLTNGISDFYIQIMELGTYTLCLTVKDENCVDRKCTSFIVAPQSADCASGAYCNLIKNSDLSINSIEGISYHFNDYTPEFELICNWYNTTQSPFYCEFNDNLKTLGMACKRDFNLSEKVAISEKLNLIDGEEYRVEFDYYILSSSNLSVKQISLLSSPELLGFGPTISNYYPILQIDNLLPDEISQSIIPPRPCEVGEKQMNHVSHNFIFNSSIMGGYFAFGGEVDNDFLNYLYITNFKLSRCVGTCGGEISIGTERIDDCTYEFAAITEDPVQDYTWEFSCEESIHGSPIVTHSFLYPGLQEVCLIVNCDNSTTKICEQVTIPETCFSLNCDNITTNTIPVVKCSTTEDTYIANFEFNVPKGYKPCSDNNCFNGDVNIEDHSYIIDTSNPLYDVLKFSVEIENAQIGQIFSFSLCGSNGGVLCYQYTIGSVQECLGCNSIAAIANCSDIDPNDGILEYSGTFNIPLPSITGVCGVNSSQAGFSLGNQNGSTFNFSLSTSTQGSFSFETIICFKDENDDPHCYNLTISIINDCNPENCEELPIGVINCSSVSIEGNVVFNLSTAFYKNYIGEGFVLCDPEGIAISSGTYFLTSADYNVTPDRFSIELEFILDCDDLRAGLNEVELELHFCNEQGVLKCLILNIPIECIDCSMEGEGRSRVGSENTFRDFKIYPNPASTDLFVNINSENLSNKSLKIYDTNGQVVLFKKELLQKNQIKIDNLSSGVYLIVIIDNLNVGFKEKLFIIR